MCGIVGYVGRQEAAPLVLNGLRQLEYRGYDSAGLAVLGPDGRYLGVFSEKCSMRVLLDAAVDSLPCTSVECFVDRDARTIEEETDLLTIAHVFHTTPSRRLPVLRDGYVIGQVSRRDVLRAAFDMLNMAPDRETGLLYVSSILDRKEAPIG